MNRKKDKDEEIKAFLGKGAEFSGKLVLSGLVRIDGEFKGEVLGSGTLVIGEGAYIEADIAVDNIIISGEVRGDLDIKQKVEISPTGKLSGNMKAAILEVQEGATIDGACQMSNRDQIQKSESEAGE